MNQLNISHFKAGDDFNQSFKAAGGDILTALRTHAAILRADAETLEKVAFFIELVPDKDREQIKIKGDTHAITLKCPKHLLDMLKKMKLIGD